MAEDITQTEIETLYRRVAEDAPRIDVLQMIYDLFHGSACALRWTRCAWRIAAKPEAAAHG